MPFRLIIASILAGLMTKIDGHYSFEQVFIFIFTLMLVEHFTKTLDSINSKLDRIEYDQRDY